MTCARAYDMTMASMDVEWEEKWERSKNECEIIIITASRTDRHDEETPWNICLLVDIIHYFAVKFANLCRFFFVSLSRAYTLRYRTARQYHFAFCFSFFFLLAYCHFEVDCCWRWLTWKIENIQKWIKNVNCFHLNRDLCHRQCQVFLIFYTGTAPDCYVSFRFYFAWTRNRDSVYDLDSL